MENRDKCLNCHQPTSHNFCKNCGQRTSVGKLNLKDILTDIASSMFNLEGAFFKTMRLLFVKPKVVFYGYIRGERVNYFSPIRYLLLAFFIAFAIGKLVNFDIMELQEQMSSVPDNENSIKGKLVGQFMAKYLNLVVFIFPFCIAFVGKLFFWQSEVKLIERVAIGFYIAAQFLILSTIPMLLSKLSPELFYTQYVISIAYVSFAKFSFYKRKFALLAVIKAILAAFLSIMLYFAIAYIISVIIINQFEITSI